MPAGRGFPGATFTYGVQHAPLVDHNDDGFCCDALDVEVTGTTSITVLDLDRSMGRVKFQNDPGSPAPAGTPFTLSYSTAVLQTHPVSVYSTLDPKGFALVLRETGADTGKFKGTFATDGVTGTTLGSTVTTTSDRTVVTGFLNERDFGIDLNGDGDTSDKQPVSQFSTLDETVARLDSDGDGVTTSDDAGVDLNGDGAVTSTPVFGIDVAAVPESPVRPTIRSAGGAIVTVAYEVGGARQGAFVTIDTATPTISVLRPREGEALRTRDAILLVEVIDSVSGVDEETIKFVIDSPAGATTEGLVSAAIRGGFQVQAKLTGLPAQPEVDIVWHVEAGDRAGNNGASDADPETGGAQSHSFKIDLVPPVFAPPITHPVVTGHFWDSIEGKVVTDPAAASSTSIRVAFFEDIDGARVQRSDFTVDGTLPAAARSFAGAPNMVFLTVPHLASDARPRVVLVGEIKDAAGNARTGGLEAIAADRISPGLTLSASPPAWYGERDHPGGLRRASPRAARDKRQRLHRFSGYPKAGLVRPLGVHFRLHSVGPGPRPTYRLQCRGHSHGHRWQLRDWWGVHSRHERRRPLRDRYQPPATDDRARRQFLGLHQKSRDLDRLDRGGQRVRPCRPQHDYHGQDRRRHRGRP